MRLLSAFLASVFLVSSFMPMTQAQSTIELDQAIEDFWFQESTIGGQAESLIIYGVEEVMNFVTDIDKDGAMNHDNLDRLLASLRAEAKALSELDQDGLENALTNGRIDKFLGFMEYLRRYGREMLLRQQLELRRIRVLWRRTPRKFKDFRRTLRQAQLRVRRHVTEFYDATVKLRASLKNLDRDQRLEVQAEIEMKAKAFRDRVREFRDQEYEQIKETYEQWCRNNPTDCELDMEARRTRQSLQLQYKKAVRVIECLSYSSPGLCFRTVESFWREMGASAVRTLPSANDMVAACKDDVNAMACKDQEQVVRADLQRLKTQIEELTGVIWQ